MNFPQFWARAICAPVCLWRWSATSLAEAQTAADSAARQLAARFRDGNFPPHQNGYYPDRPLREQITQEFKDPAGKQTAVVTRNSYGCFVLNTARVMFVDIDLPEPKPPGLFQRLFGKPAAAPPPMDQATALAKVEHWTQANPTWGWRIYRTRAGLRLLAVQAPIEPDSDLANSVFAALGADPLYRKLCQTQKCYRARLNPKPWRCGITTKPERWPWLDARAEKRFERWDAQYRSFSAHWATCELLRQIGNPAIHPEIAPIIQFHDQATRTGSNLKLA
jgi:hypothetical protein